MAEGNVTETPKLDEQRARELLIFNYAMDHETAELLWQAMSVLEFAIKATDGRPLDRTFLQWPLTGRVVWDLLDKIMVHAKVSDGKGFDDAEEAA